MEPRWDAEMLVCPLPIPDERDAQNHPERKFDFRRLGWMQNNHKKEMGFECPKLKALIEWREARVDQIARDIQSRPEFLALGISTDGRFLDPDEMTHDEVVAYLDEVCV